MSLTTRAAIQTAIDALGAAGGTVTLPPAVINLDGPVIINPTTAAQGPITLQGSGWDETTGSGNGTQLTGTGNLILADGVDARGLTLRDFSVVQTLPTAPLTGTYDPPAQVHAIQVMNLMGTVTLDNIHIPVCSQGILVQSTGRARISRISGHALDNLITLDGCTDAVRLSDVHHWPWNRNDSVAVKAATLARCSVIRIGRVDGLMADRLFGLNCNAFLHFFGSTLPSVGALKFANLFTIGSAYADFSRHGVYVDPPAEGGKGPSGHFNHLKFQGEDYTNPPGTGTALAWSRAVSLNGNAHITFARVHVDDCGSCPLWAVGAGNYLGVAELSAVNWGTDAPGLGFVYADAGSYVHVGQGAHAVSFWPGRPFKHPGTLGAVSYNQPIMC